MKGARNGEEVEMLRSLGIVRKACSVYLALTAIATTGLIGQSIDELSARARAAPVDSELLEEVLTRARVMGLEDGATVALLMPPVELAEAGLPSHMVMQKVLEGLAKGIAPGRVAGVLEQMKETLDRAVVMADPWLVRSEALGAIESGAQTGSDRGSAVRAAILESIGHALFRGASELSIQTLLDRVSVQAAGRGLSALGLAVAIEVLPDLPISAQAPEMAAEIVLEALLSGFAPGELRELPAALVVAERRGQLPAEAVARGALGQLRADLPAATVLQNLFNGEFPGNVPFEVPPGLEQARKAKGKGPPAP
jgi:hypothetical protein